MNSKKRYTSLIAFLLLLSVLVTGCSPKTISTNANAAFSNFTLNLFQQDAAATTIGLHYTLQIRKIMVLKLLLLHMDLSISMKKLLLPPLKIAKLH